MGSKKVLEKRFDGPGKAQKIVSFLSVKVWEHWYSFSAVNGGVIAMR